MGFLARYNKVIREREKEIGKIDASFAFWCDTLYEKCVRIFEWSGLPFPQKEVEMRLMLDGYCGFVKDGIKDYMVASGGLSGVTVYWDEFTDFNYAAPTAKGGKVKIGKECVIIDNTTLRNPLYPLVERYAMLLAHAEITLKSALINVRMVNSFACDDESTSATIKTAREKIYVGDTDVITDKSLTGLNVVNLSPATTNNCGVMDAIDARNEILRAFFSEIGVRYNRDKKERMIESEVASDSQMLLLNISDMLKQRQSACEKINTLFGLSTSVKLSKEFTMIESEDIDYDN